MTHPLWSVDLCNLGLVWDPALAHWVTETVKKYFSDNLQLR